MDLGLDGGGVGTPGKLVTSKCCVHNQTVQTVRGPGPRALFLSCSTEP